MSFSIQYSYFAYFGLKKNILSLSCQIQFSDSPQLNWCSGFQKGQINNLKQ
uniref:Uncharacterized protein n=1 Tax=Anguilla anguilla TaxID=7936 RepID=A0A0E9Q0A7_ANGAN